MGWPAFLLCLLAAAAGAMPAASPPYSSEAAPLSDQDFLLLLQSGHQFDEDGRLYGPGSQTPLGVGELGFALEEARSRAKLKTLLEIEGILNRNNYRKKLPPQDVARLRQLGSENWLLFSKTTRKSLRRHFTDEELEALDAALAASGGLAPPPQPPVEESLPALSPLRPAPEARPLPRVKAPPKERAYAAPAAIVAAAAPVPAALPAPWLKSPPKSQLPLPEDDEEIPLPAPWSFEGKSSFQIAPAAPPPIASVQGREENIAAIRPTVSAPLPVSKKRGPAAAPDPFSLPWDPSGSYPEHDPKAFASFLSGAPYGKDVKALLQLLADRAEPADRRVALGLVQLKLPHIVLDSQKSGERAAAVTRLPAQGGQEPRVQLALNDGPVIVGRRSLMLSKVVFLVPDAADYYRALRLQPPAQAAFSREKAPESEEEGDWGRTRVYRDGSARLRYGEEQLAGLLLKELIRLDASLRGLDSDAYHTELRAASAQFRFYRSLSASGKEPRLDRASMAEYKSWLDRPQDYADFALQTLSAPRWTRPPGVAELDLLAEAGLSGESLSAALKDLPQAEPEKPEELAAWVEAADGSTAHAAWLDAEKRAEDRK